MKNSFLILIVFGILSCKSTNVVTGGSVSNISDAKLRNSLADNSVIYDKLYSKKLNISFEHLGEKKKFKGSYVIQKDSVIVISILAVMGIEVVRAQFTPNAVTIIDKHNKKVFKTDYTYFFTKYNIDINYYTLQGLLDNTAFAYPPSDVPINDLLKKYKHGAKDNLYTFSSIKSKRVSRLHKRDNTDLLLHDMFIYPDLFRIKQHFIKDFTNNQTVTINYDNFKEFGTILFPEIILLEAGRDDNKFVLSLNTNYIDINKGGSLHFKIPTNYEITDL